MSKHVQQSDPKPLRVLHCLRAPVGGLFRHVRDLVVAQATQGFEVGVICSAEAGDPLTEQHLLRLQKFCKLGLHRITMQRMPGISDLSIVWQASSIVRACGPDILHGHGAKGGLISRLVPAPQTVQRFYTPHGGSVHTDPKSLVGVLVYLAERAMLSRTSGISFESEFARGKFQERFGNLPCRTTVVHNGVLPEEFKPVVVAKEAADFLFVGELRRLKGVFTLIEAFERVVASYPSASLSLIGSGPDAEELYAEIRKRNLDTHIRCHPAMPMAEALRLGRCGLMPSHHDSLPYVALEMIAADRPLIATDVGGLPEIFGEESDLLVPSRDPEALGQAMTQWLTMPDTRHRKMVRVRERVRNQFSTETMAAGISSFYQRSLGYSDSDQTADHPTDPLNSHVEHVQ